VLSKVSRLAPLKPGPITAQIGAWLSEPAH